MISITAVSPTPCKPGRRRRENRVCKTFEFEHDWDWIGVNEALVYAVPASVMLEAATFTRTPKSVGVGAQLRQGGQNGRFVEIELLVRIESGSV